MQSQFFFLGFITERRHHQTFFVVLVYLVTVDSFTLTYPGFNSTKKIPNATFFFPRNRGQNQLNDRNRTRYTIPKPNIYFSNMRKKNNKQHKTGYGWVTFTKYKKKTNSPNYCKYFPNGLLDTIFVIASVKVLPRINMANVCELFLSVSTFCLSSHQSIIRV